MPVLHSAGLHGDVRSRGTVHRASVAVLLLFITWGSTSERPLPGPTPTQSHAQVVLATTTEIIDSGLLDSLLPYFEQSTGYHVSVVPVNSTAVSSRDAALASVKDASAAGDSKAILSAAYAIVGPSSDRANVKGKSALDALRAIAATGATWVSRRDGLDTNRLELDLWQAALGRDAQHEGWYVSTYKGMSDTLDVANRRKAYTLTDKATYLKKRDSLQLRILVEGDPLLTSVYSISETGARERPNVNSGGVKALTAYLLSPGAQAAIAGYGVADYGEAMFAQAVAQKH